MEWETPTKINLNANTNVNVNILANVLVCTYTSAQSDKVDLHSCSIVMLPIDLRVCLCTIFS